MKKTPPGWPRITSSIFYDDAGKAIDWLCSTFGFEVRLRVEGEGGRIEHSELTFGDDGLVCVGTSGGKAAREVKLPGRSPRDLGGANTQILCLYVDDVEAHCAHARKVGATIVQEPTTSDYGEEYWVDRSYSALDPEGHMWFFMQRMRTGRG